jgi:biofilm PGA synthesis N-glycosyltransferase PgaC
MVYNMGPETLGDFVRQRRRNYAGHLHLKRKYGYRVSSLDNTRVARLALTEVWRAISHTTRLLYVLTALAAIELYSRILGSYDYYVRGDKHVVWDYQRGGPVQGRGDRKVPEGVTGEVVCETS